jgi:hypothetical protein
MQCVTPTLIKAPSGVGCCTCRVRHCLLQVAEAERRLQLLKGQLLLAQAKQQSIKLQIKYAQVRRVYERGGLIRLVKQSAPSPGAAACALSSCSRLSVSSKHRRVCRAMPCYAMLRCVVLCHR